MLINSTPRADGFRMPAEWEPHQGCWMLFPERRDTWRENATHAQQIFTEVATAIATFEPVTVGVSTHNYLIARKVLPNHIRVVELSANDAWMRDIGATGVVNSQGDVRGIDWRFNAWGEIYHPYDLDQLVAQKMLAIEGLPLYKAPLILEGGSIHVDGEGTLITTEECLLHTNRNPNLTKQQIEHYLLDYTGVDKIIWLGDGVFQDETDGHVDNLCCFVAPAEVALTWTDDPNDPQYAISRAAYEVLQNSTDAKGRSFTIHKLHQPTPLYMTDTEANGLTMTDESLPRPAGDRMAASYVNFYIANGGIVMPAFGDPMDQAAQETLQRIFPDREIVAIYSREILLGGGNIHCITQQVPQG